MSKMEFLGPFKAEKFKKQKWVQFCRTPCIMQMHILIIYNEVLLDVKQLALCSNITSADWGEGQLMLTPLMQGEESKLWKTC